MTALVGLLYFTTLFIPQLAFADSFSDTYLMLAPSMSGDYNYNNGYNDGYRQASGIKLCLQIR